MGINPSPYTGPYRLSMAVFTLMDEQIVWTDKSSGRTNRLDGQIVSYEQIARCSTGRTNFLTNKSSDIWPSGKTIFLPVETNKSTTVRNKITSDGQMPGDLVVL